jgi:hypothetical protein
MFLSLVPEARFKIDQLLDAVKAPKSGSMTVEQMVGKTLRITVDHQEYNGTLRAAAVYMLPYDSTENPPVPAKTSQSAGLPVDVKGSTPKLF